MAVENQRSARASAGGSLGTAPYMAKIVNHLDPVFQGGLEVSLIRESGNQMADETQTYVVRYASPFYGSTAFEFSGKNVTYDDAQKSYGFCVFVTLCLKFLQVFNDFLHVQNAQ